jgi:hypothetical protein
MSDVDENDEPIEVENPGKRGVNWTEDEAFAVSRAWVAVSEDSGKGADMKSNVFWKTVEEKYRTFLPPDAPIRQWNNIRDKWNRQISHDVSKFAGLYARCVRINRSGTGTKDILDAAQALYLKTQKKKFKFLKCWEYLRTMPK